MNKSKKSDFTIFSCQAVLFTPEEELSAQKLMKSILHKWVDLFNDEPVIVPTGKDDIALPRDLPKIQLKNVDSAWRCNIAPARIDILWQKTKKDLKEIKIDEFFQKAFGYLEEYRYETKARIGRMAGVIKRYKKEKDPGKFLAKHFCKENYLVEPFNRPENFEIHAHKRYRIAKDFLVNSWVRNKSAKISFENEQFTVITVDQDINTLNEDINEKKFSKLKIKKFFDIIPDEFDAILNLYYPRS